MQRFYNLTRWVDEGTDLDFEISRQGVVLKQDAVSQGLVPALDLAPGLRIAWRAANVLGIACLEPVGEVDCDVAGAVIGHPTSSETEVNPTWITSGRGGSSHNHIALRAGNPPDESGRTRVVISMFCD